LAWGQPRKGILFKKKERNMPEPFKISDAEALYKTMHNSRTAYMETNQGVKVMCDWLHLLRDARGEVHNPWTDKPISVLELGCGNGKLCDLLSSMKLDVTGVDITDGLYDRSNYKFIKHDLTEFPYPFKDGEFDYCINFDVMEHLPENKISGVLREMARVGRGIITKIACSGSPPLHITVKSPGWWLNQLIVNCPDFSWRLLRNCERICQNIKGQEYFIEQMTDVRPIMANVKITYAPLFYGKRGEIA
jgi:SAM-dependent methyltransferase